MTDPDDIRLSTRASLILIGCAGLALGLFLYFGKVAIDEAVRLIFGPG
ncbi:hypothetical protein [Methylocystis sp. SC2]|nr:hypothetical protein [Methylocystis sp. SC2]